MTSSVATSSWRRGHVARLFILDLLVLLIVTVISTHTVTPIGGHGNPGKLGIAVLLCASWITALVLRDAYSTRVFGIGIEEFKRVGNGTVLLFFAICAINFVFHLDISRSIILVTVPLGALFLFAERVLMRRWLQARRARGHYQQRTLLVGDLASVEQLRPILDKHHAAGLRVVGFCLGGTVPKRVSSLDIPVLGSISEVAHVVERDDIDVVAVAPSSVTDPETVRTMSWELEGSGVDLIVSPTMTDVAGPRISVRTISTLPLMYIDEPAFTGWRRVVKTLIDRTGAFFGLLVLSPILLASALAIRLTSAGPIFFKQNRVGIDNEYFTVFKFRTMYADAEARRAALDDQNETTGHLFKMKNDPRITPLGRFLRKTSIDELPQLINVLKGDMSVVGPRPLPVAPEEFIGHERRRHMVKPGITGLWQVSGRSDLSWEDSVRLDLYYVENWSLSLDFAILVRTIFAVFASRGAY